MDSNGGSESKSAMSVRMRMRLDWWQSIFCQELKEKKEIGQLLPELLILAKLTAVGFTLKFRVIQDRHITIIRWRGQLHAIDSICFHGGGPLGSSEIEDLPDVGACLVCPWHFYRITLDNGDKVYQSASMVNGKLEPGAWKRMGRRQRVHQVQISDDKILIKVNIEGDCASDKYAKSSDCAMQLSHKSVGNVDSARNALPKRLGHFFRR